MDLEITDSGYGIDSLPYKGAKGSKLAPITGPTACGLHELLGIVDAEAGMKLESDVRLTPCSSANLVAFSQ